MKRLQGIAANKGTGFRYYPEFRYVHEDNGTDFRYLDLSR
jgi:hypothetical protein